MNLNHPPLETFNFRPRETKNILLYNSSEPDALGLESTNKTLIIIGRYV